MTAFRYRLGLFECLVTPFGLVNVPATFQKYIKEQLWDYLDVYTTAYMNDVLVYTDGRLFVLHGVSLKKAGLYLDIDQCDFLCQKVKYLDFILVAGVGIRAGPEKLKAILEWKAPNIVKDVRSLLAFAKFGRCFMDKFSNLAAPLFNLTKKSRFWHKVEKKNYVFDKLKNITLAYSILLIASVFKL